MPYMGTDKAPQAGSGPSTTGVGSSTAGGGSSTFSDILGAVTSLGTTAMEVFGRDAPGVTVQGDYYGSDAAGTGAGEGGQTQQEAPGFPWGWVVGGVAAGGLVIFLLTRK